MRKSPLALCCLVVAGAAIFGLGTPRASGQQATTLTIATQAPSGTVWMNALYEVRDEVRDETGGDVVFKFIENGALGDEKAVADRMRAGRIEGGLFTGIGLGEFLPETRALELPFLFEDDEEVEAVRGALVKELRRRFFQKNCIFLGWADVGWAYIFSTRPARTLDELRQRKIWVWHGDKLAETIFEVFDIAGEPLSLPEVNTALQTEKIDSVYNSPSGLISLQWDAKIRYMSRMSVGHATGALLLTKAAWMRLSKSQRRAVAKASMRHLRELTDAVRRENRKAIETLKNRGVEIIPVPTDEMPEYKRLGREVADRLVGTLYSQEWLDRVRALLAKHREEQKEEGR